MNELDPFHEIQRILLHDPVKRGIEHLQVHGDLEAAARSLASAQRVVIVTGFTLIDHGCCETDGPPGVIGLAEAIRSINVDVAFLTDRFCRPDLEKMQLTPLFIDDWPESSDPAPTHLVSVERLGRAVNGRYYSMRGRDISSVTGPIDDLFLRSGDRGPQTIGIGDGGNEIGMGKVRDAVVQYIPSGPTIATIVATDLLITAGTSNWGCWGLIAALSLTCGRNLLPTQGEAIEHLRRSVDAGMRDGVTGKREATVDGLALDEYLTPLTQLRELVDRELR